MESQSSTTTSAARPAPRGRFVKDDGTALPVSDDFLLPFLNPTSPGTQYWESPPPGVANDRQRGRILLQLHQFVDLMRRTGIETRGKRLLDIGTGNGMIPRLMLEFTDLGSAVGIDPFLDGEHRSSWQVHDRDELFVELADFIRAECPDGFDFARYGRLTGDQHFSLRPAPAPCVHTPGKEFRFAKIGAHDIDELDEKFDIFYAKAIDHIPDWAGIFRAVAAASNPGAVFVIKHFSFFSFLGPHRYSSTNIPWGHLLLTDAEYRRFAHEFHGDRADQMIEFYFEGLAYPRTPMSRMVRTALDHGFVAQVIINEPLRNIADFYPLTREVDGFWDLVARNWPDVSAEELFSGRYHIIFRRMI